MLKTFAWLRVFVLLVVGCAARVAEPATAVTAKVQETEAIRPTFPMQAERSEFTSCVIATMAVPEAQGTPDREKGFLALCAAYGEFLCRAKQKAYDVHPTQSQLGQHFMEWEKYYRRECVNSKPPLPDDADAITRKLSDKLHSLCDSVSATYAQAENERFTLERLLLGNEYWRYCRSE